MRWRANSAMRAKMRFFSADFFNFKMPSH